VYWKAADTQIDLISQEGYNGLNQVVEGIRLMEPQTRQSEAKRQLAGNIQANEKFAKREYPDEIFISDNVDFQSKNRFTKGLIIPENVKVAESRVPISAEQRRTLNKEL